MTIRVEALYCCLMATTLLALDGCGSHHSSSSSSSSSGTGSGYSVGGTISGLDEGGLVLQNGKDLLSESTNIAFTFPTLLPTGTAYDVQVVQQPSGQTCLVTNATGTMSTTSVTNVAVVCGQWAWRAGSDTPGATGNYGTVDVLATTNVPGARSYAASWTDSSSNFWLFGGGLNHSTVSVSGQFNDLWLWDFNASEWEWVSGSNTPNAPGNYGTLNVPSTTNVPGARFGATTWIDSTNRLWLFGGEENISAGNVVQFNDLWMFNPLVNGGEWTWVGGSSSPNAAGVYGTEGTPDVGNAPGARAGAISWIDSAGNLWLYGGYCYSESGGTAGTCSGTFNDLWKFSPASSEWTWVSGSDVTGAAGSYGTQGTAAAGNVPGARTAANAWTDQSGKLWLFGGTTTIPGSAGGAGTTDLNDLWSFDPATSEWTWQSGSQTSGAPSVYGQQGIAAKTNVPGARDSGTAWTDTSGNFWLFGGQLTNSGTTTLYGDVWLYRSASGEWMWVGGATTPNASAVYGSLGVAALANTPGGRAAAANFIDGHGNPWLFGGTVGGGAEFLNDLWQYVTAPTP